MTTIRVYAQSCEGYGRADMYEFKTEAKWQTFVRVLELTLTSTAGGEFYRDMFGGTWFVKRFQN